MPGEIRVLSTDGILRSHFMEAVDDTLTKAFVHSVLPFFLICVKNDCEFEEKGLEISLFSEVNSISRT